MFGHQSVKVEVIPGRRWEALLLILSRLITWRPSLQRVSPLRLSPLLLSSLLVISSSSSSSSHHSSECFPFRPAHEFPLHQPNGSKRWWESLTVNWRVVWDGDANNLSWIDVGGETGKFLNSVSAAVSNLPQSLTLKKVVSSYHLCVISRTERQTCVHCCSSRAADKKENCDWLSVFCLTVKHIRKKQVWNEAQENGGTESHSVCVRTERSTLVHHNNEGCCCCCYLRQSWCDDHSYRGQFVPPHWVRG